MAGPDHALLLQDAEALVRTMGQATRFALSVWMTIVPAAFPALLGASTIACSVIAARCLQAARSAIDAA